MRAVRSGFLSVYTESESVTLPHLVRLMQEPEVKAHPMDYLTRAGDPWALRHYHVPLSFYPGAILAGAHASNRAFRVASVIVAIITSIVLFFLLIRSGVGPGFSSLIVLLITTNPCFIATSIDFSPHIWFLLCASTVLFMFARFLETERKSDFFVSCIALACTTASMELSLGLLPAALCALVLSKPWWVRAALHKRIWLKWMAQAIGVYLATCFVLWPAGFIYGGYVKSYGVFVSLALFKRSGMYGPSTPASIYARLFGSNPALVSLVVLGICAGIVLISRGRAPKSFSLFLVYSMLAFVLNIGTAFLNKTYAADTIFFLLITVGLALHYWIDRRQ